MMGHKNYHFKFNHGAWKGARVSQGFFSILLITINFFRLKKILGLAP